MWYECIYTLPHHAGHAYIEYYDGWKGHIMNALLHEGGELPGERRKS